MQRQIMLRDAAQWIGVAPREVERWSREGKLPLTRDGGVLAIEPASLKHFLMGELATILARRREGREELLARRVLATLCSLERDEPGRGEGEGGASAATKRVLVVDDSEAMADLVMRSLRGAGGGIECLWAPDGIAACDILAGRRVDLALVDILMPNMDGVALCRLIRECVRISATRLLVVSGLLGLEIRRELAAIGVDGMIEKPFRAEVLAAKVRSLLDRSPAAAA